MAILAETAEPPVDLSVWEADTSSNASPKKNNRRARTVCGQIRDATGAIFILWTRHGRAHVEV